MNTYRNRISNPFRMNTYEKTGGGRTPPSPTLSVSLVYPDCPLQRAHSCLPRPHLGEGRTLSPLPSTSTHLLTFQQLPHSLHRPDPRKTPHLACFQLLADSFKNNGGVGVCLTHSCFTLLPSAATHLLISQRLAHSLPKTPECTPILLYPETLSGGAIL